ncbi:MAG TPA: pimeloyl-ACP methyl ester esterase BioH [Buchnera sp. (in: enterobacteria)]|nr:pimeloyl-ACP methyl ester esterase BioH [Buchnera sp. (in: enterobacteria)]
MKNLYWERIGIGNINLILLHGWGLNMKIWNNIILKLYKKFTLYVVDLPGYGKSNHCKDMNLDEMAHILFSYMPKDSIWLGWSMGGLIVTKIALYYSQYTRGIINVASSPCFIMQPEWPGIKEKTLKIFYNQLNNNYMYTIQKFIDYQTLRFNDLYSYHLCLKTLVLSHPKPNISTLKKGLHILSSIDLRTDLLNLTVPNFYIYGALDSLVPKKIAKILNDQYPNNDTVIMKNSAHAPFISQPTEFCNILYNIKNTLAP